MTTIQLAVDARNPGEFLAVCGLLEVLGRYDANATSAWRRAAGTLPSLPSAAADVCEINGTIDEAAIAAELAKQLGTKNAWKAISETGRVELEDAIGAWTAGVEVTLLNETFVIDHWYERASISKGAIASGSATTRGWKFWAGQQDRNKGICGLILDLVNVASGMGPGQRLQDLFAQRAKGRAPFKVDPTSSRSAIDRGVSANDAENDGALFVRPAIELFALLGMSTFFPPRRFGDAAPGGTIGIRGRTFRYWMWRQPLLLSLARLHARGFDSAPDEDVMFEAPIGGKEYAYLKFARPAGEPVSSDSGNEDENDEENSDE